MNGNPDCENCKSTDTASQPDLLIQFQTVTSATSSIQVAQIIAIKTPIVFTFIDFSVCQNKLNLTIHKYLIVIFIMAFQFTKQLNLSQPLKSNQMVHIH